MDKYNLSDIFSDLDTQSSVILPKSIKIKNIKLSNTTSSFMPQESGYSDATSSFMPQKRSYSDATSSFMPQKGGYLNNNKNKDITQLLSMLSATSHDNYTTNSTDNAKQLNKLLNKVQYGGNYQIFINDCRDVIEKLKDKKIQWKLEDSTNSNIINHVTFSNFWENFFENFMDVNLSNDENRQSFLDWIIKEITNEYNEIENNKNKINIYNNFLKKKLIHLNVSDLMNTFELWNFPIIFRFYIKIMSKFFNYYKDEKNLNLKYIKKILLFFFYLNSISDAYIEIISHYFQESGKVLIELSILKGAYSESNDMMIELNKYLN